MKSTYELYEYLLQNIQSERLIIERNRMAIGTFFWRLAEASIFSRFMKFDFLAFQGDVFYYLDYFNKVSSIYSLCNKFHVKPHSPYYDFNLLSNMLRKKGIDVCLLEWGDLRIVVKKHAMEIQQKMGNYFEFPDTFSKLFELNDDKRELPLSFQNRYCYVGQKEESKYPVAFLKRVRDVEYKNVLKNIDYIKWVIKTFNARLYVIGDRNKDSAYRIPEEFVEHYQSIKGLTLCFKKEGTDILHDIYVLLKTKGHIAIPGSGMSYIAMLLGKPMLMLETPVTFELLKPEMYDKLPGFHSVFFKKSFNEKKTLTEKFIVAIKLEKTYEDYRKQNLECIKKGMRTLISKDSFDILEISIQSRNYEDMYRYLTFFYLDIGEPKEAIVYLSKLDDYALFQWKEQLYYCARRFKDLKDYKIALRLLNFTLIWACKLQKKCYIGAVYFHIGEIYFIQNRFEQSIKHFNECLNFIPEHRRAKEYILMSLIKLGKRVIIWTDKLKNCQMLLKKFIYKNELISFIVSEGEENISIYQNIKLKDRDQIKKRDVQGCDAIIVALHSLDVDYFKGLKGYFNRTLFKDIPVCIFVD